MLWLKQVTWQGLVTPLALALALLFSAVGSTSVRAQDQDRGLRTKLFMTPEARISRVAGGTAVASGFNTGWVINNSLILGGASFSTNYGIEPTVATASSSEKADFRYRGGLIGWSIQRSPSVNASITSVIGRGRLQGISDNRTILADRFWVFEPMANLSLRLNSWAALSAGAGYRFVSGGEYNGVNSSDLRSPIARIGVTLGGW